MKIAGNEIRPGNVIEHKGRLWKVISTQSVKPGKGGAYAQVEMKDIVSGSKLNERFRSSESVERARLDQKECQYLYFNGENYAFMDQENFNQLELSPDLIGEAADFLQDGMVVIVEMREEMPLSVNLPEHVAVKVEQADAVVKGQTASSSFKPAVLENGRRVMVPPYIESGTEIIVNTKDGSFVERVK